MTGNQYAGGSFELLGHINPSGDKEFYPLIVYAVGTMDKKLVFAYINTDGSIGFQAFEGEFVKHDDATKRGLYGFDPARHNLFAFSDTDVTAYDRAEERSFFESLLQDPGFCADAPFHRWDYAELTGNLELITATVKAVDETVKGWDYKREGDMFIPLNKKK